jgi:hypothetical protein
LDKIAMVTQTLDYIEQAPANFTGVNVFIIIFAKFDHSSPKAYWQFF